jgi:CRP/FNR family cyclic AMP-dependent transcriptional regulator
MRLSDGAGYLASALVVVAFCMKDIIPLRLTALGSNIAFLIYGLALGLTPVWLLHAVLLPVNGWRLWEAIAQYQRGPKLALEPMSCRKPDDVLDVGTGTGSPAAAVEA